MYSKCIIACSRYKKNNILTGFVECSLAVPVLAWEFYGHRWVRFMQINRFGIALHYSEPGVVNILKQRWEQMCVWTSSSENSAEEISFCEHKYSNTMKLFANKAPRVCSLYSAISFSCDSIYSSLRVLFTMAKASNSAPPWTFGRPQTCVHRLWPFPLLCVS